MATKKISATKNYRLFARSNANRPLDMKKHRKLEASMKKYGFLPCFPIVCHRNGDKALTVKDGQHRLSLAETLGIPVHYVEEAVDFDTAEVNETQKVWNIRDYAMTHAANGSKAYQEGLDFADQYGLSVGIAFAMLAGKCNFSNVGDSYRNGSFKIKDRDWADRVAGVYSPIVEMAPVVRNVRFLEACMAVCRVEEFDAARLIHSAGRCRDKLVSYSTRDAYLAMLEEVYNFGRQRLFGLKIAAAMAMRERNPAKSGKKSSSA